MVVAKEEGVVVGPVATLALERLILTPTRKVRK
jgi:hypothetical protein